MLTLPPSVRIHVGLRPVDMRAQFDGLAGAARRILEPLFGRPAAWAGWRVLARDRSVI